MRRHDVTKGDLLRAALVGALILYATTRAEPATAPECATDFECVAYCPINDPDCDGGPEDAEGYFWRPCASAEECERSMHACPENSEEECDEEPGALST